VRRGRAADWVHAAHRLTAPANAGGTTACRCSSSSPLLGLFNRFAARANAGICSMKSSMCKVVSWFLLALRSTRVARGTPAVNNNNTEYRQTRFEGSSPTSGESRVVRAYFRVASGAVHSAR
jgi:hypothetical protein